MKSSSLKHVAFAALLALCAAPAFAADDGVDDTAPEILQTQHALRAKLDNPTGEYAHFSSGDLSKMRTAQDEVFHVLDGVTSLDQLNAQQKMELSNALDEIKATLAGNESQRLICHRERKIGTNIVEKRCETAAERELRARESEKDMMDMSRSPQTQRGG